MVETLKRLGGGRWASKDERFTVEPQSGTWVLVDSEQTDDLGLPLVRGPFPTLTAARAAIDAARSGEPAESPLAGQVERARASAAVDASVSSPGKGRSRRARARMAPTTPPEPGWLRDLEEVDGRRARRLIERLEQAGIPDPEQVARSEIVDDAPAVARVALQRRVRAAVAASDAETAVALTVEALLSGGDEELEVSWQLVDGDGRRITALDLRGSAGDEGAAADE